MVAADLKNITPKYVWESGVARSSPLAHRGKSGIGRTWSWTEGLKAVPGIWGSSDGLCSAHGRGVPMAFGVWGRILSLPLTKLAVENPVVSWIEWGSHIPCRFILRTKEMTHNSLPRMQGEIYIFYPCNWRLLGMGYNMLETESHHKSISFFF